MMQQWQQMSEKFSIFSLREQLLILLTGSAVIVFMFFTLVIDNNLVDNRHFHQQKKQLLSSNKGLEQSVEGLQQALTRDPNIVLKGQLKHFEQALLNIDQDLLTLTSELINPVQMRYALTELLVMQGDVKLLSFELIAPSPLVSAPETAQVNIVNNSEQQESAAVVLDGAGQQPLTLYRHGIKLKLQGSYFQLRDYLQQLEKLNWRFFWQDFDYKSLAYPKSELDIEIYSLSTKRAFIGV